jgi:hypothetical protein
MSLTPKDMDFIEAKHAAAREIALALGVPPMLLGIPGDNTYSNYQEANRTFWRQTVLPLVNRTAKALSAWLAPAFADLGVRPSGSDTMTPPLELRPDLDAIEALSTEREALWSRIDKATFLTPNEKRSAVGYGPVSGGDEIKSAVAAQKFNPHHDDRGRFTFGPNPDAPQPAQARDRPRRVTVGGRTYPATPREETELLLAANRAEAALNRVRELDPEWRPAPQLSEPQSAESAISAYRSLAQQAEGRATVLERGGVPLGFNSREQFEDFGRATWDGLAASGHRDAEPFLRGSAVTGFNYRTGEAFDVGRQSDYDIALASPSLMRRAEELGIELREQGSRTRKLEDEELPALGLRDLASRLREQAGRDVSLMIYRSREAIEQRGPSLRLP